jgi:hypothetical protein
MQDPSSQHTLAALVLHLCPFQLSSPLTPWPVLHHHGNSERGGDQRRESTRPAQEGPRRVQRRYSLEGPVLVDDYQSAEDCEREELKNGFFAFLAETQLTEDKLKLGNWKNRASTVRIQAHNYWTAEQGILAKQRAAREDKLKHEHTKSEIELGIRGNSDAKAGLLDLGAELSSTRALKDAKADRATAKPRRWPEATLCFRRHVANGAGRLPPNLKARPRAAAGDDDDGDEDEEAPDRDGLVVVDDADEDADEALHEGSRPVHHRHKRLDDEDDDEAVQEVSRPTYHRHKRLSMLRPDIRRLLHAVLRKNFRARGPLSKTTTA